MQGTTPAWVKIGKNGMFNLTPPGAVIPCDHSWRHESKREGRAEGVMVVVVVGVEGGCWRGDSMTCRALTQDSSHSCSIGLIRAQSHKAEPQTHNHADEMR